MALFNRKRTNQTPTSENAGTVFADFYEKELRAERDRRATLDARAVGVLNTSATLVTLLLALGAVVTGATGFEPPTLMISLLSLALVAFVAAALLGLLANRQHRYSVTQPVQLHKWRDRDGNWNDTADKARRVVAKANILTIASLRQGNNTKATLIEVAHWCQLAAVILLGAAIGTTLIDPLV